MKMELIAACCTSRNCYCSMSPPSDWTSLQATIQPPCGATPRGVTMLLTSHYMRDVEAPARVLVINHGISRRRPHGIIMFTPGQWNPVRRRNHAA
jgi:hypothetical protein